MNGGTEMDVRRKQSSEKRLIDAKAFAEHLERLAHTARTTYPNLFPGLFEAVDYVKDFPAVDAVEVVRCKDCRHMEKSQYGRYCQIWGMYNGYGDDGFCCYGERKEGAD